MAASEKGKTKNGKKKPAARASSSGNKKPVKKAVKKKSPARKRPAKKAVASKGSAVKKGDKKAVKASAEGVAGGARDDTSADSAKVSAPDSAPSGVPASGGVQIVVNMAQIVALFGVTRQAIHQWKEKDTFPQAAVLGYNQYDLALIYPWYQEEVNTDKDMRLRKAETALKKLENEKDRIGYDARSKFIKAMADEGKVVETRKVVEDVGAIAATLASGLEGAKKRFPSVFANKTQKELMLLADQEIDALRHSLHKEAMKLIGRYDAEERKN